MNITFKVNFPLNVGEALDLYRRSTLAERRPVDKPDILAKMLTHADLIITAWENCKLVGIARTLTDYGYVAYMADLAVDKSYQRKGIGKQLIELTEENLDKTAFIVLLAAPDANEYYPKIGFQKNPRAWVKKLQKAD